MNWRALAVLVAVLGVAPKAEAADIKLYGGMHFLLQPRSILFDGGLMVGGELNETVSLAFRGGVYINTDYNSLGIPLDVVLRFDIRRSPIYFEAFGGPWISLDGGQAFRAHAGGGFGAKFGSISVGLEVAYYQPWSMIGPRFQIAL